VRAAVDAPPESPYARRSFDTLEPCPAGRRQARAPTGLFAVPPPGQSPRPSGRGRGPGASV